MKLSCNGTLGLILGLFRRRRFSIEFKTFCNGIYPNCPRIKNQGMFVSKLFAAAGSTFFSVTASADTEYQRKLYNGRKPLTDTIRSSFPKPFNEDGVVSFLEQNIEQSSWPKVAGAFQLNADNTLNTTLLAKALSRQLQFFISSEIADVDDIVCSEYQKLLVDPDSTVPPAIPLYPGDKVWSCTSKTYYDTDIYVPIEHTWIFKNIGSVPWVGRKLIFTNHGAVRARADANEITIPPTQPNGQVELKMRFDPRHFDCTSECVWEMVDDNGKPCFPGQNRLFCLTINAIFTLKP